MRIMLQTCPLFGAVVLFPYGEPEGQNLPAVEIPFSQDI
jgi:hypothetical protein